MDTVVDFFKHLDDYGLHVALIISGAFGAFVMMGKKKELTLAQAIVAIISGGAIANYLTPVVFEWVNLPESTRYGLGFLLGTGGLESVKWAIFKLKDKYGKN
jgi:lipoprotein signal peptidase